jgi:hypothetical protein
MSIVSTNESKREEGNEKRKNAEKTRWGRKEGSTEEEKE